MADNREIEEKLMSENELKKAFEKRDTGSTYTSPVRDFLRENKDDPDTLKKLVEYTLYALKDPRKEEAAILFSRFYIGVEKNLKPAVAAILKDRLSEEDKLRIEKFLNERPMVELGIRQKYPEFVAAVYGKDHTHEAPAAKPATEAPGGAQPARTPPQSKASEPPPQPQASEPPQSKGSKPLPATGQPTSTSGARNLPRGAYSYGIPPQDAKQNLNPVKQSSAPPKQGSEQPGIKPGSKK